MLGSFPMFPIQSAHVIACDLSLGLRPNCHTAGDAIEPRAQYVAVAD